LFPRYVTVMLAASTPTNKKSRAAASATETMLTCHLVMPKGDPGDEFLRMPSYQLS
jgi:hypothetical protein